MERTTPHNLEAEQSVLGSVFVEEGSIRTLVDKLDPDDFYKYQHKVIFRAMKDLFTDDIVIDYTTLTSKLETKGMLNDAGGIDYILGLINNVPSIANLSNYINIVKDKSITRRIMEACRKIIDEGFVADDAIEFVDQSEKIIFDIAKERRTADFVTIQQITEEVILKTEAAKDRAGDLTGLDTKFDELNRYTNGLQPSELIIIAARPSMGKSAFALNIATNVAKMKERPYVAFFSLEMGSDQLVGRMLSAESKVHSTKIRTGHLDRMEWRQLNLAQETLSKLNILFDDAGTVKITDLRQKCRKLAQEKRLDLVIIDYLQLLSGSRNDVNRVNEVSEISRTLKEMARELKIPVIALSQLSRNVERRDSQVPVMADLRDSGSIEQDADIVIFLYREDYYKKDTPNQNEVDVIISKNRQGATTSEPIKLAFNMPCSYFANRASGSSNSTIDDVE